MINMPLWMVCLLVWFGIPFVYLKCKLYTQRSLGFPGNIALAWVFHYPGVVLAYYGCFVHKVFPQIIRRHPKFNYR